MVLDTFTTFFWPPSRSRGRKAAVALKLPTTLVASTSSKSRPCLQARLEEWLQSFKLGMVVIKQYKVGWAAAE